MPGRIAGRLERLERMAATQPRPDPADAEVWQAVHEMADALERHGVAPDAIFRGMVDEHGKPLTFSEAFRLLRGSLADRPDAYREVGRVLDGWTARGVGGPAADWRKEAGWDRSADENV
jgi:hypothetical protein